MKSCFFIGHREAERELLPLIIEAAEHIIQENQAITFYTGGYGSFDHLAGEAVIQLKKKHPDSQLYMVIPYHPAERPIEAPTGYDGTFYPDGMETISHRYAISRANRKMIDMCDYLIAYVTHPASNSGKFLEYARRREKKGLIKAVNLGEARQLLKSKAGDRLYSLPLLFAESQSEKQ